MAQKPTNRTDDPMTAIMSADDRIDALPAFGVKDLYVRAKLMKWEMEAAPNVPDAFGTDGFKAAEQALMHQSADGVRCHYASKRAGYLRDIALETRGREFILAVFDRITNDNIPEGRKVRAGRAHLKNYLRGSLGMPDDRVIRENLKNYDD